MKKKLKVLALFDAIGSADKQLHANPGRHQDVPAREFDAAEAFFRQHLSAELEAAGR